MILAQTRGNEGLKARGLGSLCITEIFSGGRLPAGSKDNNTRLTPLFDLANCVGLEPFHFLRYQLRCLYHHLKDYVFSEYALFA